MADRPRDPAQSLVGRLYDAYGASLYRYAVLLLADPAAAEDAVQQVFATLLRQRPRIDNEAHYLRRAVRTECYSALRRRQLHGDAVRSGPILEPVMPGALSIRPRGVAAGADMNDPDIEGLLRRYRPVGPPADLRARVLSPSRPLHVWPWATAAALLLASTLALQFAAARAAANVDPKLPPEPAARAIEDLTGLLGGDAAARRLAEFIVVQEQMRSEGAPAIQPDVVPEGEWR